MQGDETVGAGADIGVEARGERLHGRLLRSRGAVAPDPERQREVANPAGEAGGRHELAVDRGAERHLLHPAARESVECHHAADDRVPGHVGPPGRELLCLRLELLPNRARYPDSSTITARTAGPPAAASRSRNNP